jgi:hypothetical protein
MGCEVIRQSEAASEQVAFSTSFKILKSILWSLIKCLVFFHRLFDGYLSIYYYLVKGGHYKFIGKVY